MQLALSLQTHLIRMFVIHIYVVRKVKQRNSGENKESFNCYLRRRIATVGKQDL